MMTVRSWSAFGEGGEHIKRFEKARRNALNQGNLSSCRADRITLSLPSG